MNHLVSNVNTTLFQLTVVLFPLTVTVLMSLPPSTPCPLTFYYQEVPIKVSVIHCASTVVPGCHFPSWFYYCGVLASIFTELPVSLSALALSRMTFAFLLINTSRIDLSAICAHSLIKAWFCSFSYLMLILIYCEKKKCDKMSFPPVFYTTSFTVMEKTYLR